MFENPPERIEEAVGGGADGQETQATSPRERLEEAAMERPDALMQGLEDVKQGRETQATSPRERLEEAAMERPDALTWAACNTGR